MQLAISHQTQTSIDEAAASIQDWITVDDFCQQFSNIPKKTLKWQLTTRDRNGLSPHVQVIGKRRYISIKGYASWLKENAREQYVQTN
jgi:hypothetical protein